MKNLNAIHTLNLLLKSEFKLKPNSFLANGVIYI